MAITTFGWDIVSLVDTDMMNSILEQQNAFPDTFDASVTALGLPFTIDGSWSTCGISRDSDGRYLHMTCVINNGTFCFSDACYEMNAEQDDDASYVTVVVELDGYEANPEDWAGENDETQTLTEDTRCYTLKISKERSKRIYVTDIYIESADKNPELESYVPYISEAFEHWFNDNISEFGAVFSAVLLDVTATDESYQWMKPSAYSYAAASTVDEVTSGYSTIVLTESATDTGSLQQAVDIMALEMVKEKGGNCALILSQEKFTKHFLMRCLVHIIKDSTEDDFILNDDELSITTNKDLVWGDFVDDDGNIWSPLIPAGNLLASVNNDAIDILMNGLTIDVNARSWAQVNYAQRFKFKYIFNDDGGLVVIADENANGRFQADITVYTKDWVHIVEDVMGAIAILAGFMTAGCSVSWRSALVSDAEGTVAYNQLENVATASLDSERAFETIELTSLDREGFIETAVESSSPAYTEETVFSEPRVNPPSDSWMRVIQEYSYRLANSSIDGELIARLVYANTTMPGYSGGVGNDLPSVDYIVSVINEAVKIPATSGFTPLMHFLSGGVIIGGELKG